MGREYWLSIYNQGVTKAPLMTGHGESFFHTTMWSVVLRAGGEDDPARKEALDRLSRLYWRPLYIYCLAGGRTRADAEDLTQGFFAHLLAKDSFRLADPNRGKFRSFLLSSFKNYITGEHWRMRADKRGGGVLHVPLDHGVGEVPDGLSGGGVSPELAYDIGWARDLLARATTRLRSEMEELDKLEWFELVAGQRAGASYASIATEMHSTEEAVKSFAKRLRRRFREILEEAIADTVDSPEALIEEMAYLARLLRK